MAPSAPSPEQRRTLLRLALAVVVVDIFLALVMTGGRPPRPSFSAQTLPPSTTTTTAPDQLGVAVVVRPAGGRATTHCFLQPATPAGRSRGIDGRPTVAPYAGVAVLHDVPTTTGVTAAGALFPYVVAYINGVGGFVSAALTTPCPSGSACRRYPPAAPYRLALEVPARTWPGLGLGAGATAHLAGPC